ncbi:RNA-directed DNA polymerase (Reverse transcriptase) [Burkholderia aenigmatica]|uniref:RNA-directed DNA polymerase (Reverse transcriptase) n=1 Tax=Burkholderia aenigmatica TaxID=2015348 RepID=A0A6P2Q753_9BURK|nr:MULTISPECIES: RNA-directed DNA polymerase [Burkholderia]VWC18430.1 RNA-directed DNA polymerase (Reverse transcriptase) [Burkholderia aenigmatica]
MNLDDACNLSIEHISAHGPSDITLETLETKLINSHKSDIVSEVRAKIRKGNVYDMGFKPIQHILTPKNRYVFDYRKAAIIDPLCLAKYTAIVLQAAEQIERSRIPTSEKIVYSARFSPKEGALFDKNIGYGDWRERVKELATEDACTYVVQCDIASFYDRINIHRVESTLLDIGVDQQLVTAINSLLLLWSKKDSYGIPIGNSASRIIAEAALIDVDRYLIDEGVKFVRYVDDFRIFAPNLITAQRWMNLLTTRLFRDGLMLNTGKTKLYLSEKGEESTSQQTEESPEAIIKKVTKLTGGYNRIARTFIMPTSEKYEVFKKIDIHSEINTLKANGIPEFSGIQKLIIACLVQQNFDLLEYVAILCGDYLYSLDYFVDMLLKNSEIIPQTNKEAITNYYAQLVLSSGFGSLEWHQATLAKLLSSDGYFRKPALIHIVRVPNKDSVTYPSMIALEGLKGRLTREEFRTIREWFDRCDEWEKRRIINAASALPEDERRAWGRAIKPMLQADFLATKMADDLIRGQQP